MTFKLIIVITFVMGSLFLTPIFHAYPFKPAENHMALSLTVLTISTYLTRVVSITSPYGISIKRESIIKRYPKNYKKERVYVYHNSHHNDYTPLFNYLPNLISSMGSIVGYFYNYKKPGGKSSNYLKIILVKIILISTGLAIIIGSIYLMMYSLTHFHGVLLAILVIIGVFGSVLIGPFFMVAAIQSS